MEDEVKYYSKYEYATQRLQMENNSLRAEIKGINAAYEHMSNTNDVEIKELKELIENIRLANGTLFRLLGELTETENDLLEENKKLTEWNNDLKNRNAKLREILVDTLKRN